MLESGCQEFCSGARAVGKDLPYPSGKPDAGTIARNVYFVNHVYAVRNLAQRRAGDRSAVVVNKASDGAVWVNAFERYLNNDYRDGVVKARNLVIFSSGRLRGTGILATVYEDEAKGQAIVLWLPELRKARRVGEPPLDDAWGGSVLTYGDVYLRTPEQETHELLGEETFAECLETMDAAGLEGQRALRHVPARFCEPKGRPVYKLKSTNGSGNGSYDYRIQDVDVRTFADYRSVFHRDGKPVKLVDKAWVSMELPDPRGQYARYWCRPGPCPGDSAPGPRRFCGYTCGNASNVGSDLTGRGPSGLDVTDQGGPHGQARALHRHQRLPGHRLRSLGLRQRRP